MILSLQIILWTSIFLIAFSYLIYPFILKFFAFFAKEMGIVYSKEDDLPFVKIIMAVYNEEKVIIDKLQSLLTIDYPQDKLSIVIGSDASDDQTVHLIKSFQKKNLIFN